MSDFAKAVPIGFPRVDCADVDAKTLVITDGDAQKAASVVKEFADKLWDIRDCLRPIYPDIPAALGMVEAATEFPVTLADTDESASGGPPADSAYFLKAARDRGNKDVALALYWDPVLIEMCQDAGVSAGMRVRVDGKICAVSGDSVDLDVTVGSIRENMFQAVGETPMDIVTGVWLEADRVHLILASKRTQCFAPTLFTDLRFDYTTLLAMIPKFTNHFYQNFARVSPTVIHVRTPGSLSPDMTIIPFTKRDGKYWPKVDNPFA